MAEHQYDGVAYNTRVTRTNSLNVNGNLDFDLKLATDLFDKWIQRDVNAALLSQKMAGYVVLAKGGDVNKISLNQNTFALPRMISQNYS